MIDISIAFVVVQAVAHQKHVGNDETSIRNVDIRLSLIDFVEQDRNFDGIGIVFLDLLYY